MTSNFDADLESDVAIVRMCMVKIRYIIMTPFVGRLAPPPTIRGLQPMLSRSYRYNIE